MTWVLILYIYAGALADGDSVTLQSVPGFSCRQSCEDAGERGKSLVRNSAKEYRYVCLEQK